VPLGTLTGEVSWLKSADNPRFINGQAAESSSIKPKGPSMPRRTTLKAIWGPKLQFNFHNRSTGKCQVPRPR